jgi:hypothetical protein
MKNYEKYAEIIKNFDGRAFCSEFVIPNILKPLGKRCVGMNCQTCNGLFTLWLMEEYEEPEEPEVDWSKVEVDTPILVKDFEDKAWYRRYFARYENGIVYAWNCGCTSWSENIMTDWKYAKLAESEEGGKSDTINSDAVSVGL